MEALPGGENADQASSANGARFEVRLEWETHQGQYGAGQAMSLPHGRSTFWFFVDSNVELVIKVLDASSDFTDLKFWVYTTHFINVAIEMPVTDALTGVTRTYSELLGAACEPGFESAWAA